MAEVKLLGLYKLCEIQTLGVYLIGTVLDFLFGDLFEFIATS
jgi:hypothetical protein